MTGGVISSDRIIHSHSTVRIYHTFYVLDSTARECFSFGFHDFACIIHLSISRPVTAICVSRSTLCRSHGLIIANVGLLASPYREILERFSQKPVKTRENYAEIILELFFRRVIQASAARRFRSFVVSFACAAIPAFTAISRRFFEERAFARAVPPKD